LYLGGRRTGKRISWRIPNNSQPGIRTRQSCGGRLNLGHDLPDDGADRFFFNQGCRKKSQRAHSNAGSKLVDKAVHDGSSGMAVFQSSVCRNSRSPNGN